jgi:beta-glucosidase
VPAFAEYADVLSRTLGDRVRNWITLNEPRVVAWVGHYEGRHAPGHRDVEEMLRTTHHLFLAHAAAMPAIRANSPKAQIGLALDVIPCEPASSSKADQAAAYLEDGIINRMYLDPLFGRGYPEDVIDHFGRPTDFVRPGDLDEIAAPIDLLGVNYYRRHIIRARIPEQENSPREVVRGDEITDMDWEVYPDGLHHALTRLHTEYSIPNIFVTENGAAFPDPPAADARVPDEARTRYLQRHFAAAARAVEAGVPLAGYFVWSLMDNFEWAFGYRMRFGLIQVDLETQERTLKDSALWYQSFLEAARSRAASA